MPMNRRIAVAWTWTALIFAATLLPSGWMSQPEPDFVSSFKFPLDKAVHICLFLGYGFLWAWAGAPDGRRTAPVLIGGILLAVLTEAGQALPFIERDPDVFDAMADTVGLFFGIGAYRLLETLGRRARPRAEPVALPIKDT